MGAFYDLCLQHAGAEFGAESDILGAMKAHDARLEKGLARIDEQEKATLTLAMVAIGIGGAALYYGHKVAREIVAHRALMEQPEIEEHAEEVIEALPEHAT
jgi:hypothetical protein